MVRLTLVICGLLALLVADTRPAAADLQLCNNTESRVGVALGYNNTSTWVSEGWWNIDANSCKTILKGDLIARYYYIYAVDYDHAGTWGGKAILCTEDTEFVIEGNTGCVERGYNRQGFFEVDTGEEADWTVSLSGASAPPGQNQ